MGRTASAGTAKGFDGEFPDPVVHLEGLRTAGHNAILVWTLERTHRETGNRVKLGGQEDLLVSGSRGRFDAAEYDRRSPEASGRSQ